jgi:hypothetical protein
MDHPEKRNRELAQEPPQDEVRKFVEEYAISLREFYQQVMREIDGNLP